MAGFKKVLKYDFDRDCFVESRVEVPTSSYLIFTDELLMGYILDSCKNTGDAYDDR